MDKSMIDDQERIILLRRFHERRDAMLAASKEIEDLRTEYISNGRKDQNSKIESEVIKRLLIIFSCLSELGASRFLLRSFEDIYYIRIRREKCRGNIKPDEQEGLLHVCEAASTAGLCALANLMEIRWALKKGPYVDIKIENLDSIFKAQVSA